MNAQHGNRRVKLKHCSFCRDGSLPTTQASLRWQSGLKLSAPALFSSWRCLLSTTGRLCIESLQHASRIRLVTLVTSHPKIRTCWPWPPRRLHLRVLVLSVPQGLAQGIRHLLEAVLPSAQQGEGLKDFEAEAVWRCGGELRGLRAFRWQPKLELSTSSSQDLFSSFPMSKRIA